MLRRGPESWGPHAPNDPADDYLACRATAPRDLLTICGQFGCYTGSALVAPRTGGMRSMSGVVATYRPSEKSTNIMPGFLRV